MTDERTSLRITRPEKTGPSTRVRALAAKHVQAVNDMVEANFEKRLFTGELAAVCAMSRGHFSRAFKETFGLPPHRWVLTQRIDRAKGLLARTEACLTEVASLCGFADQPHFSRAFKAFTGTTPAVWRRARTSRQ